MADSTHPVRLYRKAQSPPLALSDLAGDIGVTKATLSRIETGKMPLSVGLATKLRKRTGIPMSVLCPDLAPMFEDESAAAGASQ
jgi:transcriptional regulator with XRE-family HTH domain